MVETPNVEQIGVLLSGVALDVHLRPDGTSSLVDVIEQGGLFGDGWGKTNSSQDRALTAATPGTAVILEATRLIEGDSSCSVRSKVVDNFLKAMLIKANRLGKHLELVTHKSLRQRILNYLTAQQEKYGTKQFTIPLSRADLAEYLHADRSALSRELARMQDESILDFYRNSFVLY